MQRFFNSPMRSKYEDTIRLGIFNLSGNGGEEKIRFSGYFWLIVSLPYSISISVTVDYLGIVGISNSICGRVVSSSGEITRPNLSLSSFHFLCSVSRFEFSTI